MARSFATMATDKKKNKMRSNHIYYYPCISTFLSNKKQQEQLSCNKNPSCKVPFQDLMFIMSSCRNTFAKMFPKRSISYIKVNISFETIVNLTKHNQYTLLILFAALVIQMKLQGCYENENFKVMQST